MPPRAASLKTFMERPEKPAGEPTYHELCGFVFAVSSAPDLIKPSEWLPVAFDGEMPTFKSMEEANAVTSGLIALYNAGLGDPAQRGPKAPSGNEPARPKFRRKVLDNLDESAEVSQWSRGFVRGHNWLEETWEPWLEDELSDEMGACLLVLSFFSSKRMAEGLLAESRADMALETFASHCRDQFQDAMDSYANLGRSIWSVLARERANSSSTDDAQLRVGRNEPCPCGSGKKFKRCCGA